MIYVLVSGGVFVKIVISLIVVFIISFLLICKFIYKENKQEPEEEQGGLFMVVFVSIFFSLIITGTIGLFIFALLGSTNMVNIIFSLNMNTNQLMIVAISFSVYLFILDDMVGFIVEYIFGKNIVNTTLLTCIRIGIFHIIGYFVGLGHTVSLTIATGVALLLVIEVSYRLREKSKHFFLQIL